MHADHVVPQSKGGGNTWENLVTCCGQSMLQPSLASCLPTWSCLHAAGLLRLCPGLPGNLRFRAALGLC